MTRDRALDWVRKLRAKAASCADLGNLAEAEAFENKAGDLMAAHGLRMVDVDPPRQAPPEPPVYREWAPVVHVVWSYTTSDTASTSSTSSGW